jgi:F-type H+-transporting ATPase subunit epsilon
MKLTIRTPAEVIVDEPVARIKAEAENGWFGLLPKHIDFVTALVPGILIFEPPAKPQEYVALDHGILVKCGAEVAVSTRNAVRGTNVGELKQAVETQFREREEAERKARAFEAKLEADLVRRLLEAERHG